MTSRLDLTNELLRLEDIEGLLSMGAPHDEYGPEAEMMAGDWCEPKAATVSIIILILRSRGTVTVAGDASLDIPPGTLNNILKQAGLK